MGHIQPAAADGEPSVAGGHTVSSGVTDPAPAFVTESTIKLHEDPLAGKRGIAVPPTGTPDRLLEHRRGEPMWPHHIPDEAHLQSALGPLGDNGERLAQLATPPMTWAGHEDRAQCVRGREAPLNRPRDEGHCLIEAHGCREVDHGVLHGCPPRPRGVVRVLEDVSVTADNQPRVSTHPAVGRHTDLDELWRLPEAVQVCRRRMSQRRPATGREQPGERPRRPLRATWLSLIHATMDPYPLPRGHAGRDLPLSHPSRVRLSTGEHAELLPSQAA